MKVLIAGDANSIWIKTVIEHTLIPFHDDVTLLPIGDVTKFVDYYQEHSVEITPFSFGSGVFTSILKLYKSVSVLYKKKYDIICIHCVAGTILYLLPLAKLFCKKTILVFWGSDILRQRKHSVLKSFAYRLADRMGISTNEMIEKFHILYGHKFDDKIRRMSFGAKGLETIKKISIDLKTVRKKYSVDDEKIVISIGYNRMIHQQHVKVLKEIQLLDVQTRSKIHLVVRLTYGSGDAEYIQTVKEAVMTTGCSNSIFESFLSDVEIAELTCITDIFIQGQTTDARSASMCEHLFAKCLVINPSWIHYSELEGKVFYLKFDRFDDLPAMIEDNLVMKENSRYIDQLNENSKKIYDLVSWDAHVQEWRDIYVS